MDLDKFTAVPNISNRNLIRRSVLYMLGISNLLICPWQVSLATHKVSTIQQSKQFEVSDTPTMTEADHQFNESRPKLLVLMEVRDQREVKHEGKFERTPYPILQVKALEKITAEIDSEPPANKIPQTFLYQIPSSNTEDDRNSDSNRLLLADITPLPGNILPSDNESADRLANDQVSDSNNQPKPDDSQRSELNELTNQLPSSIQEIEPARVSEGSLPNQSFTTEAKETPDSATKDTTTTRSTSTESAGPNELNEPDETFKIGSLEQKLVTMNTDLRECRTENQQLINVLVELKNEHSQQLQVQERKLITENALMESTITELTRIHKHDRRTNIRLNEELLQLQGQLESIGDKQCRNETERADSLQINYEALLAHYDELEEQLGIANTRIEELQETLIQNNLPIEEGFSYVGGLIESYVKSTEAEAMASAEQRLTQDQCGDAMEWLIDQQGDQRALVKRIWVWKNTGETQVCKFIGLQGYTLEDSTPKDEAHLVVFH